LKQIVELGTRQGAVNASSNMRSRLDVTDAGRAWLAEKGYDSEFGARPLRRLIQNEVEDSLSDGILSGKFQIASVVRVTVEDDQLKLENVDEDELETPGMEA
jgi:ATP-dependent Clp protease ATP-binding subunit ClpC